MKGIRTIALRLTGTKEAAEELEEMGEDTSDMIMSQSKMRDLIMNATKVASNNYQGFDIQDELGRYKSTFEIMLGLAQIWDEIQQADFKTGDNRQNLLLESIAGKNRASIAASILQNPETLQSVYEDSSTKAAGSAMEENEKYLQSISGHIAKLTNAWQEMWANAANRDVINAFIDLATILVNLINKVGLLGSAFVLVWGGSILKGLATADSWLVKFIQGLNEAKTSSQSLGDVFKKIFSTGNDNENGARLKGLEQIRKDKENRTKPPVVTPALTPEVTENTSESALDMVETATKNTKADASRNAAQANMEEMASEEALKTAQQENIITETEETVTKTEGASASRQAVQENIKEAESIKLTTEAIKEKAAVEALQYQNENPQKYKGRKKRRMPQHDQQVVEEELIEYYQNIADTADEAAEASMDWTLAYVGGFDKIEAGAEKTTGVFSKIGTGFSSMLGTMSSGLSSLGSSLSSIFVTLATNPMTWLVGIPAAIGLITTGFSMWQKYQQDLIDGAHEATNTWNENKTSLDGYAQQYQDLSTQLNNVNLSEQEQADIKKQIFDLQKQITDEYGHAADGVSLVNGELDVQLAKLRQIKAEEAKKNLLNNEKEYQNAQKEMEAERTYDMIVSRNAPATDQAKQILDKYGYELKQRSTGMGTIEQYIEFKGDASDAEQALQDLFDEVGNFSEDERTEKGLQTFFTSITAATERNNKILRDHQDAYNSFLEQKIFANDNVYGDAQQTAGEVLIELEDAVNDYNIALQSGDTSQIEKTQKAFEDLKSTVGDITQDMGDVYSRPFDNLIDKVDSTAEAAYNIKKKFDDPKTKNVVESILGTPKDNKKSAEEIPDSLRSAAENLLEEQEKAYKWGMKSFGVNPIQGIFPDSQFGNIDMNNRPIIKWNDDWKKQFAEALKSWNYNPEEGMIDTVFGGADTFNGLGIAFTPILTTEDGKTDFMSYDAVHEYIQGLVEKATDKDGNIDAQLVLDLDAGKVKDKDIIPKQIIGAIDGISKYSAATVGKMMHFSGTKGAIYLGMEKLSKAAKDAGLDVQKVMDILQKTGNVDALSGLFDDFKYDVTDIEGYLSDLSNLPPEIANDIQTIADAFGITTDSSQESISAVAELLGSLGYIATTSLDEAGESFDKFALKASGWIEETSNLSSVLSKGQGFLTFTKTQDDQGHEIASEVKALADAYKDLPGYNYASLFEETAGGIMVNADALRALQSQEESMRHAEFYEKRQELMQKFLVSSGAVADAYRQEIEQLDMLWSAYSGATSALSKYQNGHGAADYSTNYKLFRDQIFKEGDEYLASGEIGEEGFRRIAQLFSYKDLALASVDEVLEAYQNGADTMQKFFTEDPTQGANLWIDEIMSWPEEYAEISTNAAGETVMTMTDKNLDAVAEHYGVSKDLILSLMNELNATGSKVHFFTDGQMQQLDKVTEQAEAAKQKLIQLKDAGTDPALKHADIFDFDIATLSAEELESKIKEIQDLKANPDISTETASALDDLLQSMIERLDIINGKHVEPDMDINVDTLVYAKEITGDLNERLNLINENRKLGFDISVRDDQKVQEIAQQFAQLPEEVQIAYGFNPTNDPEEIITQIEEKYKNGVEIKLTPVVDKLNMQELYESGHTPIGAENIEVGVGIDPTSIETAKQQAEEGISQAKPEIEGELKMPKPEDAVWTGASIGDIHINLDADPSQANEVIEETKEEAEEPVKTPMELVPKNTAQDAANQAGAQQGVNTTTTETKITNEETHTVATTDTAQLDSLNQKMQSAQAMNGSTVSIGVAVSGLENIETAESNVNELIAKDKSKVTVSINGNAAMFNKAYTQTNSALTALAQKKPEPKITADYSSLKEKVNSAKDKLNSIKDKSINISASQSGFTVISSWKTSVYDKLKDKDIYIKTHYSSTGSSKQPPINGSAHAIGTVVSHGRAFANGSFRGQWGLPQDEKGSLINEIGPELVVNARTGQWQILNNGYPAFADFKKGDIIFNANQTESLLKNGYIRGSYAKLKGNAFTNGTVDDKDFDEDKFEGNAYAVGTTKWNGQLMGMSHAASGTLRRAQTRTRNGSTTNKTNNKSSSNKSSNKNKGNSNKSNSSNKSSKDTLQTLDAIEIRLNRIDALISQLDATASKTYESFGTRNKALKDDLATVNKEIQAINASLKSADTSRSYLKKAAAAAKEAGLKSGDEGYSAGSEGASGKALSQTWIKKIQNSVNSGQYFTLSDVRNEGLWKKIQAYQTWYEKYVKLQQKVQEQTAKLSQLTIQQLSLIQSKWEATLNTISANITTYQNRIDLLAEQGYNASEDYYTNQILENQKKVDALTSESSDLQKKLDDAVKTGRIKQYSEEWFKWYNQIKGIKNEIIATNKEMQTLLNSIRQLRWDKFDHGQERLADLADEMEFLGGLINEIDLFDKDTGIITDKGKAAFGLEAQRYDIYIKQAQKYKEAVKELNKEINEDFKTNKKYNQTLIEQRDTWLKAQREAIENAHSEKEAIADLVEKGIKKQIEAMEELIDKYEEALDVEKNQQKYADDIAERQKKINSLQKQLRAMEGDDSEEGASRRQKLRDELKEAQKDLQETQEDQRISDIKEALSNMQERYEEVLNARLDNIDALLEEVVSGVNQNGADICETIKGVATSVGYDITGILNNIYTGVQNLNSNVANVANQSEALVSGSTDNGSATNTSAKTLTESTTPSVPVSPTMPSATTNTSSTSSKKTTTSSKNGLIKENGKTYYYKNNKKQTAWQTINGKKYYFSVKDGAMLTGVQKIGNKYYLLDSKTGALKSTYTGLYKQGTSTYYFKSGNIQTGWRDMKEGRRYFSVNSGKMLTGLQKIGGDDYYFNSNGILQTGTFSVKDYTYETDKDGKIKKKTARAGRPVMKTVSNTSTKNIPNTISGIGTIKGKLASGTSSVVRSGMYRVDEEGNEVFINKQGKIYTRLGKGTTVLPHDAAVNLLKGMSDPVNFIASHMDMRPNKNISTTNNTNGDTINNITFEMNGITNYAEFMREAQRDPNFTKYIQEISIGKLNGHNSLKGNSIRFR